MPTLLLKNIEYLATQAAGLHLIPSEINSCWLKCAADSYQ